MEISTTTSMHLYGVGTENRHHFTASSKRSPEVQGAQNALNHAVIFHIKITLPVDSCRTNFNVQCLHISENVNLRGMNMLIPSKFFSLQKDASSDLKDSSGYRF